MWFEGWPMGEKWGLRRVAETQVVGAPFTYETKPNLSKAGKIGEL